MSHPDSTERAGGGDGIGTPALGAVADPLTAAPSPSAFSILPPDDYELLRRIEKLEAHVRNLESVIQLQTEVILRFTKGRAA